MAQEVSRMKGQGKQEPLLETNAQWFHVFRNMIERGDAAKMGPGAFLVYATIKCFTDIKTGKNFPSLAVIAEKSGFTDRQVRNHLKVLEENGYLEIDRTPGKKNVYILKVQLPVFIKDTGELEAMARFDYVPMAVQQAVTELKNFTITGNDKDAKVIKIERLNLTINIQNNQRDGYVIGKNVPENVHLKEQIERIKAKQKSISTDPGRGVPG